MSSHYEVFAKCPTTAAFIRTGHKVENSEFEENEKPYGQYNCSTCKKPHAWRYDDDGIHIRLVAE